MFGPIKIVQPNHYIEVSVLSQWTEQSITHVLWYFFIFHFLSHKRQVTFHLLIDIQSTIYILSLDKLFTFLFF